MSSADVKVFILFAVSAYSNLLFVFIILSILQSLAGLRLPDWLRPAANFVYDCCEPFLRVFRGLLPALRMGGMGLDLSPILAFISLRILSAILERVFF